MVLIVPVNVWQSVSFRSPVLCLHSEKFLMLYKAFTGINSWHTFWSLLPFKVTLPEANNCFTCMLGRCRSMWSLVLGIYLVSLRPRTGNQFQGTPADQPSCLQDSHSAHKQTSDTLSSSALVAHDLPLAFEPSKTRHSRTSCFAY